MIKDGKSLRKKVWNVMPLLVAAVAIGIFTYFWFKRAPVFVDYETLVAGNLNEAQKETITMVTELNKFLVSLGTLMFGAIGFYLTKYKKEIQTMWVAVAFLVSLILVGLTYYYAFRVFSQLTSELAQNALAIQPGKSRILYYIEMEFWTSLGASLILLFLFVHVFSVRSKR
jgi:hypothetical protein